MVEECPPKTAYTMTIVPDDKHQYVRAVCRIQKVFRAVLDLLEHNLGSRYDYELYTEVSKPEQSQEGRPPRIHYHGIIHLTKYQEAEFWIEKLQYLNQWCRVEVDTIKDSQKWLEYCTKDKESMLIYCKKNGVPYKLTNKMLKQPWYYVPDGELTKEQRRAKPGRTSIENYLENGIETD